MNNSLRILLDRLKLRRDSSEEAATGIERGDGTCGFTAEEIDCAPRVVSVQPRKDD
jgi:hypothetical protein